MKRTLLMVVPARAISLGGCSEGPTTPASSDGEPGIRSDPGVTAGSGSKAASPASLISPSTTTAAPGSSTSAASTEAVATRLPTTFTPVEKAVTDPDGPRSSLIRIERHATRRDLNLAYQRRQRLPDPIRKPSVPPGPASSQHRRPGRCRSARALLPHPDPSYT